MQKTKPSWIIYKCTLNCESSLSALKHCVIYLGKKNTHKHLILGNDCLGE